ncbi:hypothetical protein CEXT_811921 [Caerostris extrusa]|uniref:Uncharacterized protein n=1 Tax=Caerostris extrusa TaxID=172846 RepID=A0AAV4SPI8_CAEEX|nr:hypothetical protein CEXT_811921 [Caerostris extrusa]
MLALRQLRFEKERRRECPGSSPPLLPAVLCCFPSSVSSSELDDSWPNMAGTGGDAGPPAPRQGRAEAVRWAPVHLGQVEVLAEFALQLQGELGSHGTHLK